MTEEVVAAEHFRIRNVDDVLAANQELYDKLYSQIREVAVGVKAGKSPSLMKALVHYLPPQMAEIVVHLSLEPKKAEQVAEESGKSLEYVKDILHQYWLRGINGTSKAFVEEKGYIMPRSWSLLLGEFPFCDGLGGTRRFWDEDEEKEVAKLLSKLYFEEGWMYEWGAFKEPLFMVLVDERQVDDPSTMEDWEKGSEHILQVNRVGVTRCACRVRHGLYNKCKWVLEDSMIDVCLQFDALMEPYIDRGAGKWSTKEEALETLWYGLDHGLISTAAPNNVIPGRSTWICQCCPDCCHLVVAWTRGGITDAGVHRSNFDPKIALEKCTFEEELLCVKACPVQGTVWYHPPTQADGSDNFIAINLNNCMGCGLCATACPQKAIKMVKTRNWVPPTREERAAAGRFEFIDKPSAL